MVFFINEDGFLISYNLLIDAHPVNNLYVENDSPLANELMGLLFCARVGADNKLEENWRENAYTRKEELDLVRSKEELRVEQNKKAAEVIENYRLKYTLAERETWVHQRHEANNWLRDNTALTPTLDKLAEMKGIDREDFILKTLRAIDRYDSILLGLLTDELKK